MATVTELVETADTGNTPNATGSFTPTAGDLLVVALVATASVSGADDVPTASANGITFVRAVHGLKATSADSVDLYVANQLVPASPASMTVSWNPTDTASGTVIVVYGVSGMARYGSIAIKQVANADNQSGGGTPAITFSAACLTGNPTIVAVGNAANPAAITNPTDWTENTDTGYATPTTGFECAHRDSGFTGTTVTWGGTSASAFGAVGIELDTSAIPGPEITVFESARDTTSPKSVTVTGCVTGDVLYVMAGGSATAANNVTAASASTTAGSTGSWSELAEQLSSTDNDWCGIYKATVTGDGSVTVQVSRTQGGTAESWHFWVARVTNGTSNGEEVSTKFTADATEVINIAVAADSAVLFASYDWNSVAPGTFTPATGAIEVERSSSAQGDTTEASAYWLAQASGTRDYGTTGSSSSNIRAIAVEILAAGGASNVTLTPATLAFSAPSISPSSGPTAVTLTPASMAFSAVAVSASPPASEVTLTPAVLAFSAVALSPSPGATAVTLTPAILAFSAVALSATSGPTEVTLTPANLVFSAVPLNLGAAASEVTLTPAVLTFSAVVLSPSSGATSVTLTPATLAFSAVPLNFGTAASEVTLTPAAMSFTGVALAPSSGPTDITLTPAVLTLSAVAVTAASGPTQVTLTSAVLAFSAVPVGIDFRNIQIAAALAAPRWGGSIAAGMLATMSAFQWTAALEED